METTVKGKAALEALAARFPQLYVAPAEDALAAHRLASGCGVAPEGATLDHFDADMNLRWTLGYEAICEGFLDRCYINTLETRLAERRGTPAAERVAAGCGARAVRVAKGFEHIGEVVARLEAEGRPDSFLFGLEAGGGCLTGRYARDRDGVGAALLLCDMFAWHRSRGVDLFGRLDALRA